MDNLKLEETDVEIMRELHRRYWEEKQSLRRIAKDMGIPYSTLRIKYKKLGLGLRTYSKSMKIAHRRKQDKGLPWVKNGQM